ncbi:N-6 DNA methylase [Oryzomonas rubra]|uniref:site-specific DNA-methyltransferase (adenine-specific) n=1 Tax=Oryzomonas rubra TaxID=2509454 RepID=A0A5A9XC51_9BACT|nr:N-6 DNA methylase [Oryzomonas rubra]KAA0889839.1 SAM-dependent DNA methyltransferase [Oryzomonas rubra]
MLSPQLRRKVHDLWSLFWSSGLSNPLVAIEQITYLLFIRQLEALDRVRVKAGKTSIYALTKEEKSKHKKEKTTPPDYEKCRWSYIRQNVSFGLLNDTVFPWLRSLESRVGPAQNGNTTLGRISGRLSDAYFILDVNKTDTLKRAVSLIDDLFRQLDTRSVNSDIMGDIFEYLLEEVKESGKNGQFRTPRHVIRFMVQLLDPELKADVKILDPACGSGGFLLNSLLHWKAEHTASDVLRLEWDGTPHDVLPVWPEGEKLNFSNIFHGYDNDRTMVRIAWMNLILHDLEIPEIHQLDALSKRLKDEESGTYDYILANPPFSGSVDEGDLSENRQRFPRNGKGAVPITNRSELLFVWLMLDLLKIGGRAAVIVPDGVLFGSTKAHRELRRQLLFENTLEAVVSLPANMFQPYSGVKTSILLFQKAGDPVAAGSEPRTREVWFYEITDEAFSLDQKRKALNGQDNDLWDGLEKFKAWNSYRQGDAKDLKGETLSSLRAAAIAKDYHQPDYWEERWRSVDDEFLAIFPEKSGDKGHTYPLHELWPQDFKLFDHADTRGSRQYDDAVLAIVRPKFEKTIGTLVEQTVKHAYDTARKPDVEKAIAAAEKNVKAVANQLNKQVRDKGLLDREFDQYGLNALKTVLKEMTAKVKEWAATVRIPEKKPKKTAAEPNVERTVNVLVPLLSELAKLDGYNVWRRSHKPECYAGKLTLSDNGEPKREPTLHSWIVPVRHWAELESWGEHPKTKKTVNKPTHQGGVIDPEYLVWLRDTLKVFDDDATVKEDFLHRLDPDCLEALDFNLSAGRHKPFIFDAGLHRPPTELIGELQAIHGEVKKRLEKLLTLIEAK